MLLQRISALLSNNVSRHDLVESLKQENVASALGRLLAKEKNRHANTMDSLSKKYVLASSTPGEEAESAVSGSIKRHSPYKRSSSVQK